MLEKPEEPGRPSVRVSDGDRDRTADLLRRHFTDGRLTMDEFSDRVGLAYGAKTRADLELLTADLPATPMAIPEDQRREAKKLAMAIMSGHTQKGPWRPAQEMTALAIMGGCEIDLRQAEVDYPEITINAIAIMGGVDIIVPEGVAVECNGIPFMGGFESKVRNVARVAGTPLIRVKGLALMGGVTIRNKSPRPQIQERIERTVERHLERADRIREKHQRHAERWADRLGLEGCGPWGPAAPRPPWGGRGDRDERREPEPEADKDWREQLKTHAAPDGTVTIMFSDIEGYTELTERLGDLDAREILYAHNQIIREQVVACGGFEVKSQGDGFMLAFAGASKALRCAVRIQQAFDDYCDSHPEEPVHVRMGLHTGEALREADDFLGRTVIVASRIADEAKGGQVLVSALLKELTDGTGEFEFGELREVRLKGLTQVYRVYPVEWRI